MAVRRNKMAEPRGAATNAEARILAVARQAGATTPGAWQAELQVVFLAASRATSKSLHAEARKNQSLECLSAHLLIPKIMHAAEDHLAPVELHAGMPPIN